MYHYVSNSAICAIKSKEKCRLEKIRAAKERKQKKERGVGNDKR